MDELLKRVEKTGGFQNILNEKRRIVMEVINLKEKEVFKEDRGFANLVDEKYLQINQVCLEPSQQVPHHNANSIKEPLALRLSIIAWLNFKMCIPGREPIISALTLPIGTDGLISRCRSLRSKRRQES